MRDRFNAIFSCRIRKCSKPIEKHYHTVNIHNINSNTEEMSLKLQWELSEYMEGGLKDITCQIWTQDARKPKGGLILSKWMYINDKHFRFSVPLMSKRGQLWNSIHTISSHNTHALMTIMVTGRLSILVIFSVMVQRPYQRCINVTGFALLQKIVSGKFNNEITW